MPQTALDGLRTVVYPVADIEKAKAWYSEAFGIAPYFDEPFYVGFNVGGYEMGLMPLEATDEGSASSGLVTYWGVADADAACAAMIAQGATEHEAPHDVGGGIRLGSVYDPFGNIIGVIYNPHFTLNSGADSE